MIKQPTYGFKLQLKKHLDAGVAVVINRCSDKHNLRLHNNKNIFYYYSEIQKYTNYYYTLYFS